MRSSSPLRSAPRRWPSSPRASRKSGESTGRPSEWATAATGRGSCPPSMAYAVPLVVRTPIPTSSPIVLGPNRRRRDACWAATARWRVEISAMVGSTGSGSRARPSRLSKSSSVDTAGHLLHVDPQPGQGPVLSHAHGAGSLADHCGNFFGRQPADHAEFEHFLFRLVEAGEGEPHGGRLLVTEHAIEGTGLVTGLVDHDRYVGPPTRRPLDVEHDVTKDAKQPGLEAARLPGETVDLGDGPGHGLTHRVPHLVERWQPAAGVGEQARIDSPVEGVPRRFLSFPSPLHEGADIKLLVHTALVSFGPRLCHQVPTS